MKRNLFKKIIYEITILMFLITILFIVIYFQYNSAYESLIKLTPLIISIPAAYLGYSFQQRITHIKDLRILAYNILNAVQDAIKFTYNDFDRKEYLDILCNLSKSVDEVRMFYENIGKTNKNKGLYPFEPLKQIYFEVKRIDANSDQDTRKHIRDEIIKQWKLLWRDEFLYEFDRDQAAKPVSHYYDFLNNYFKK